MFFSISTKIWKQKRDPLFTIFRFSTENFTTQIFEKNHVKVPITATGQKLACQKWRVNNDDQRDGANLGDGLPLPSLDHHWHSSITSKAETERNYGERDAFVVMASQNHRWATVLLVLLHTSTGFTEKGDCYDEFVLSELEIFNKSCWRKYFRSSKEIIFTHKRKFSLLRLLREPPPSPTALFSFP